MSESRRAIGVDIGATLTKMVLLEAPGEVVEAREASSRYADVAELVDTIDAATRAWRQPPYAPQPAAIGVAVPGLVDARSGRVLRAPNLPILDGFDAAAALQRATGLPVFVDNDAHAAGLAEAHLGAAVGADTAVCLTIGTGLGGAIIHSGRIWRGHGGLAGEVGRLLLDPDGRVFLEEQVAAPAIEREYRQRAADGAEPVQALEVARRADAGDEAARATLAACGRRLGVGLAILVNLLNPRTIVIGGGVAGAGEWLLGPARAEAERRAWADAWEQCDVVAGRLGANAGAIGAALACWLDRQGEHTGS